MSPDRCSDCGTALSALHEHRGVLLCFGCYQRRPDAEGAPPAPTVTMDTDGDKYAGRHVDLAPLLAAAPKPIPWRVNNVIADGTATIISGESGSGKSWLAQALCTGVARGLPVASLTCTQGKALYVDAEMGPQMFVDQRLRPAGVTAPEFEYIDAMGLDVSKLADLGWLRSKVVEVGANLVVVDSLRRLTPSQSENDSDDMAPTVAAISKLARDTGAAVLLIHHKGDGEKFFRGSTAIRDQADALFALLREGQADDDGGDDDGVRRLRCRGGKGKMRYAVEPPDVFLTISPSDGGVVACDAPVPARGAGKIRDARRTAVRSALGNTPQSVRAVARAATGINGAEVSKSTTQRLLDDLHIAGEAQKSSEGWTVPLSRPTTTLGGGLGRDTPPATANGATVLPFPGVKTPTNAIYGPDDDGGVA